MKISELERELAEIRKEKGDLDVFIFTPGTDVGIDNIDVEDCVSSDTDFSKTEHIVVITPEYELKVEHDDSEDNELKTIIGNIYKQ